MTIEYETKILDIDIKEIENKLNSLEAKKEPEIFMRRWVFDIGKENWVRLRDENGKITLTHKVRTGNKIGSTKEIEVQVSDFEKTAEILSEINFKGKYYQENKRANYKLGEIEFSFNTWPRIPDFLEIESTSEDKVRKGLKLLGLEEKDSGDISVLEVYSKYGIDLHSVKRLTF